MIKIAVIGYSGAGKSTAAQFMLECLKEKGIKCQIHKLALPLYQMQEIIYKRTGADVGFFQQNQKVLEGIADLFRSISPVFIVNDFIARVNSSGDQAVICDDLRDFEVDYPVLKNEGFVFVRISSSVKARAERLHKRCDIVSKINSKLDSEIDRIFPDYSIVHDDHNIESYRERVQHVLKCILSRQKIEPSAEM